MFYEIKSRILKFLSDVRVYPLGIVLYGQTGYKVKGPHIEKIDALLKPGDVLLTRYDHYLGYLLGDLIGAGYYGHAGLYVGDNTDGPQRVLHMLGGGLKSESIYTFLRKDHVLILRARENMAFAAAKRAKQMYSDGVDYDFDFETDNETYYCFEFVWHCYYRDPLIKYKKYILGKNLICPLLKEIYKAP